MFISCHCQCVWAPSICLRYDSVDMSCIDRKRVMIWCILAMQRWGVRIPADRVARTEKRVYHVIFQIRPFYKSTIYICHSKSIKAKMSLLDFLIHFIVFKQYSSEIACVVALTHDEQNKAGGGRPTVMSSPGRPTRPGRQAKSPANGFNYHCCSE